MNDMVNNKISVIMGIYNCAKTLPEAIDSIVAQTYENWELIMCDDCSTDDTYAVAEAYVKRFSNKIILVRNETNRRLAYSLNHCLKYATGEFVARMDGDDRSLPERFEKQIAYLHAHPEMDLVGTAMQRFNETGINDICFAADKPNRYTLKNRIPFHHATIMTYKRVYDALGGYKVSKYTMRAEDYELWFRFYHTDFHGANLSEALYLVREDSAAIRRRTFQVRWNAYHITFYGFKLLGYPKYCILRPTIQMLIKSLTPYWVIEKYRKFQARCK